MQYIERQATTTDTSWLWTLYMDLLKPAIESQWGWDEAFQREMFANHLPSDKFKIIELDSIPVAAYMLNKEPDHHYVKMLLVQAPYQHKGIGQSIIKQLQSDAIDKGVPIRLSVIKANPVLGFYLKQGFTIESEDKDKTSFVYKMK